MDIPLEMGKEEWDEELMADWEGDQDCTIKKSKDNGKKKEEKKRKKFCPIINLFDIPCF